jgi:predicted RNA-binding Zn-ribbon protein involved in translation (DUF1610 family)
MTRKHVYGESRKFKWPSPKRAILVKTDASERGQFLRCPNCGFINNVKRGRAVSYTYSGSVGVDSNDLVLEGNSVHMGNISGTISMTRTEGTLWNERHNIGTIARSGCAFCGYVIL